MTPDSRVTSVFSLIITSLCFMSIPVFMFVFDLLLGFMISHSVFLSVFRLMFSPCVLFSVLYCSFCSLCVFHLHFLSLSRFPPFWLSAPVLICSTCVRCLLPSLCIQVSVLPFDLVGSSSFMLHHSCLSFICAISISPEFSPMCSMFFQFRLLLSSSSCFFCLVDSL